MRQQIHIVGILIKEKMWRERKQEREGENEKKKKSDVIRISACS